MGPMAGGGGEEEAENLSTVDRLLDVVDSFAKQFSVMRERARESADGSYKRDCRGLVVGV